MPPNNEFEWEKVPNDGELATVEEPTSDHDEGSDQGALSWGYGYLKKILKAAKEPHLADFQADLWKDAVREANHYGGMPALNFTVWTAQVEQTCLAFIEAKLTTLWPASGYVTVELWSGVESVRVPKANYTVSIAAAAASLWSRFIDDWKRTQAHCAAQTDPCRPSIANEE